MPRRRRAQRGQVAVLFAVGSLALIGIVGLVLMAGLLFWDQRGLQTLADGAALAGAEGITNQSCSGNSSGPITVADAFMTQQLGTPTSSLSTSGSCSTAYVGTASYTCSNTPCTVTYTYPWNRKPYEIGVRMVRSGIPLQFGALIGATQATITGRAVAQHNFATPPTAFALFAQNGISCQGSGVHSPSPKIVVNGSIYSAAATITPTGNCAVYAHDTLAFDGTEDFGDVLVYADGQTWANGGGGCGVPSGTAGNAVCSDGFELGGHNTMSCGNNSGTSPQTEYISGAQASNPDPCSGVPPPVTQLNEVNYMGTEPNADAAIYGSNGGRCTTTPGVSPGNGSAELLSNNKTYGWGPAPHGITNGVEHFAPGCYGFLDIGTFLKNQNGAGAATSAQLDPGFYLFNGYWCNQDNQSGCTASSGGGLCLNAGGSQSVILTGTDIALEFVNSSSFSSSSCAAGPTSACGGSACDFGTSINAPTSLTAAAATTGGTLPAGTYSFEVTYADALGESTPSSSFAATISSGTTGKVTLSSSGWPVEATSARFYLVGCSGAGFPSSTCTSGNVHPGYLGAITSSAGSLTFNSSTQGNYGQPPSTNTASIWFAAPPTSPEPAPIAPTLGASTGLESNLPAGTYQVELTYRTPEGESTASTASSVTLTAGQSISVSTGAAAQGVTNVGVYLTSYSGAGTVSTGYLEQVAAPVGSTTTFYLTSATQGNGASPPTSNTTSSSWCLASKPGWTATDAAICANRLLWAPASTWPGGEIGGTFYVKGANENSAIMGNIYWPGPASSTASSNAAGCNYDANGVGGLLGQVICDSLFVQGGSSAGTATIGWTTGARYSSPPEIALIE